MTNPFGKFFLNICRKKRRSEEYLGHWDMDTRRAAERDVAKWAACQRMALLLIKLDCNGCRAQIRDEWDSEQKSGWRNL